MNENLEIFGDIYFDRKNPFLEKLDILKVNDEFIKELLIYATQQKKEWAIIALLKHGASVDTILLGGSSLINYASAAGMLELLNYLLSNGFDVNHVDEDGATPLYDALVEGNYLVAKALIRKGADVNFRSMGVTPAEYIERKGLKKIIDIENE